MMRRFFASPLMLIMVAALIFALAIMTSTDTTAQTPPVTGTTER